MPLEVGTFIADLVATNPPTSDLETQGANHLQLIKSVLQNTFGTTVRRLVGLPTILSLGTSTVLTAAQATNTTILINTGGGAVSMTLPTLAAADAGWECSFLKSSLDTNPYFIVPPSGTIISGEYSGLPKTRRCIPLRRTRVLWTGAVFICDRVESRPIGTIFSIQPSNLPVGYEWANGQTLSSAANYPDYFAAIGFGGVADMRGRAGFGLDNPGGTGTAGRITVAGGNFDGTIIANSGGAQNHILTIGEMPAHAHTGSGNVSDPTHVHAQESDTVLIGGGGHLNLGGTVSGAGGTTQGAATGVTVPSLNINNNGGGGAHTILPPALVVSMIMVVE